MLQNIKRQGRVKEDILSRFDEIMACFCGCEEFVKNSNGKIMGCVKCNHGRQNHSDEWRAAARSNTEGSQKRDSDFG
ncbi:MAG TPA: hypothetical protein QGF44_02760 [Candidatus Nitrosopelagicus sp.]|jgi:hypothetical protein|nr:hypothetical protein [Candidatus Nitrosopelagicus sp.]|tara:strand:+ start:420 stop:650 length:231 start_codon:yes stop_codon:yes gene_type:complete